MLHQIRILASVLATCSLAGCQLFIDLTEHQCDSDSECGDLLGPGFACSSESRICERIPEEDLLPPLPDEWACLRDNLPSSADLPQQPEGEREVDLSIAAIEYTSHEVPDGLVARACLASDIDCENPHEDNVELDDEGYLNFSVPYRFSGRLEIEAPERLPILWYMNRPLYEDFRSFGAALVSQRELESLAERSEDDLMPKAGVALFGFFDCNGDPAPGVSVSRTDGELDLGFYFDGPLPDQDLTMSRLSTDLTHDGTPLAAGGFFNSKPGFVNYEIHLAETGDLISTLSVEVKREHMTVVLVVPGDY